LRVGVTALGLIYWVRFLPNATAWRPAEAGLRAVARAIKGGSAMKRGQGSRLDADGRRTAVRTALLATEPVTLDRLAREYALRDELGGAAAETRA
jgi:hypothetical protein